MTSGLVIYVNSKAVLGMAMHKKMAIELINNKMEELKNSAYVTGLPSVQTTLVAVTLGGDVIGHEGIPGTMLITSSTIDFDSPPDGEDARQFDIVITWTEPGQNSTRTISATTYIAKP